MSAELREYRKKEDLTQAMLAERLSLPKRELELWERQLACPVGPVRKTIIKLASAPPDRKE